MPYGISTKNEHSLEYGFSDRLAKKCVSPAYFYCNIGYLSIFTILITQIKGEPELTDPFNLLINVKLRML